MGLVAQGFGDPLRPVRGELGEPAQSDALAALLCRIALEGSTGIAYLERAEGTATLSFREGRVVFIEDFAETQSIPDVLLERGFVNVQQYAEIAERVLESLAENEDLAFCEQVVERQLMSQAQLDAELEQWVRGRVIQALSWSDCKVEVELDEAAVTGSLEYPIEIGPLVYIGVRTFYDEERLAKSLNHAGPLYLRLTRPIDEAIRFFGLEEEEAGFFAQLRPDAELGRAIEAHGSDPLEVLQLLAMLKFAGLVELSGTALSSERSGVRTKDALTPSQGRIPVAREERSPSQARMPLAREERSPSQHRMPGVREERVPSYQRLPTANPSSPPARPDPLRRPSSGAIGATRYSSSRMQAIREEQITQPQPSSSRPVSSGTAGGASSSGPAKSAPATSVEAPPARPAARAPEAETAASNPARERRKPRKLSATLKRLDRDLQQLRQQAVARADSAERSAAAAAPASTGHVERLLNMRRQATVPLGTSKNDASRDSADLFRSALDAMRDQQFARAYELMRKACADDPENAIYSMYCAWAGFRSGNLRDEAVQKLRQTLREKVSDDEYKAFAYYALGHISLADKRDDAAEKMFRKAVELDKNNKDAERHLRIIELRRKTAAEHEKSGKIFGIEIKPKKS